MAWSLFSRQFDHPFDFIYYDVIQNLDNVDKKRFLIKAGQGADTSFFSFAGLLIRELSEFNDPSVGPVISRWTALPDFKSFMPQESVDIFFTAYEALGKLGVDLPNGDNNPETVAGRALRACGELTYWSSREDVSQKEQSMLTESARAILMDHTSFVSAGALMLASSSSMSSRFTKSSLLQDYPNLCLAISRHALLQLDKQVVYHELYSMHGGVAQFVIQLLGECGDASDLQSLRALCDHDHLGLVAINSIKEIDNRLNISHKM